MTILGLIPARAGSKGIPNKNLAMLGGKPLIVWSIEAAKHSRLLQRCIVSTDGEAIAETARSYGAEVPFMRPANLSGDHATALEVMRHAVQFYAARTPIEILVYLQPTSPFRRATDIDAAIEALLAAPAADGVVSVVPVPHAMLPECQMELAPSGALKALTEQSPLDRHQKRRLYARNGPAIVALRAHYVQRCTTMYEGHIVPYIMHEDDSWDIDTAEDLQRAERFLRLR